MSPETFAGKRLPIGLISSPASEYPNLSRDESREGLAAADFYGEK
jgi:hypothetical protein